MKRDKSCDSASPGIKERICSVESMLKQYGISEKSPGGRLENVEVYCGDGQVIEERGTNIPVITVLIRNPLEYRELAEKLGSEPKSSEYGGEITLNETTFEHDGVKYVTLALG